MKHKKLFILSIPLVIIALILLRPAQKELEEKIKEKIAEVKSIHLVFSQWWEDETGKGALQSIIKEFEEGNPEIKVELDFRSYQELRGLALSGESSEETGGEGIGAESILNDKPASVKSAPIQSLKRTDIIALDPLWVYELAGQNRLEPLGGYMQRSQSDTTGTAASNESESPEHPAGNGTEYAVPLVSFMHPLFYNIDLLKNAGFNRPPKTWDEFQTYAEAVNNPATGRFGTAFALSPENPYALFGDVFPWIWASGALLYQNEEPDFSGSALTETLEHLRLLFEKGLVFPDSFSMSGRQKLDEFMKGHIGMMTASIKDMESIRQVMGSNFGITTIPVPDAYAGKPAFGLSSWSVGILRQSPNKNEAWTFISFLADKSAALAGPMVPGNGSRSDTTFSGDELYAKAWDMYEASDGIEEFAGKPRVWKFEAIVREELEALFQKGQSTADTVTAIQNRWRAALKQ